MPGATTRGYPYPLGPDPIDVANDIRRLAEAIDSDVATAVKVYADTTALGTTAPRITGNVVYLADGTQWRFDGTQWVRSYAPPGPWTTLALVSPTSGGPLSARANNGVLEFRGGATLHTVTSNSLIATMQAGLLPEQLCRVAVAMNPTNQGSYVFTNAYVQVPNTAGSFIGIPNAISGAAGTNAPYYGDLDVWFDSVRLPMTIPTVP